MDFPATLKEPNILPPDPFGSGEDLNPTQPYRIQLGWGCSAESYVLEVKDALSKRSITALEIPFRSSMSPYALSCIYSVPGLNSLESINLSGCRYLSDKQFEDVLQKKEVLTTLDISQCVNLSEAVLRKIAVLQQLRHLKMNEVLGVNINVLDQIISSCKDLKTLEVNNCTAIQSISDNQFKLLSVLKNIQSLKCKKIHHFKEADLRIIKKACPSLTHLCLSVDPSLSYDDARKVGKELGIEVCF